MSYAPDCPYCAAMISDCCPLHGKDALPAARLAALPAAQPTLTQEQIETLIAAGHTPAPYVQTYTTASSAAAQPTGETATAVDRSQAISPDDDALVEDFRLAVETAANLCHHRDRDLGDCCGYTRDALKADDALRQRLARLTAAQEAGERERDELRAERDAYRAELQKDRRPLFTGSAVGTHNSARHPDAYLCSKCGRTFGPRWFTDERDETCPACNPATHTTGTEP